MMFHRKGHQKVVIITKISRRRRRHPYSLILFWIHSCFDLCTHVSYIYSGWYYGCKKKRIDLKIVAIQKLFSMKFSLRWNIKRYLKYHEMSMMFFKRYNCVLPAKDWKRVIGELVWRLWSELKVSEATIQMLLTCCGYFLF